MRNKTRLPITDTPHTGTDGAVSTSADADTGVGAGVRDGVCAGAGEATETPHNDTTPDTMTSMVTPVDVDTIPTMVKALEDYTRHHLVRISPVTLAASVPTNPTNPAIKESTTNTSTDDKVSFLFPSAHHDDYTVTETFYEQWRRATPTDTDTIIHRLGLMRGITRELRHPAYRATSTSIPNVFAVPTTTGRILTFYANPVPVINHGFRNDITWLTIT